MSRLSIRALLLALAVITVLAAGAFGFWSATGAGTATTVLPDTKPVTFSLAVPTVQLYPGGDADVVITVNNPNAYFVRVSALELDVDPSQGPHFATDADHTGCDVSALSFGAQTNGGAGWRIPPRVGSQDGARSITMASALLMAGAASNTCQGALFTVRLRAQS